jgi:hypothetical protein
MDCPFCIATEMLWQNDLDFEDADGNDIIESYYECPVCETFITIGRKV